MADSSQEAEKYSSEPPSSVSKEFSSRFHNPNGLPLIDFVTNDWKVKPRYHNSHDHDHDHDHDHLSASDESESFYRREEDDYWVHPRWKQLVSYGRVPRRVQRYLAIYITLLSIAWIVWSWFLQPDWEKNRELEKLMNMKPQTMFGSNMRPEFSDMTQVKMLNSIFLPTDEQSKQRLVVVGDVHGCKDELQKLLIKLSFNPHHDHLILTGDIIDKGPDSPGTVDLARDLAASCVRGNHEDRMLLAFNDMHAHHAPLPGPQEDPARTDDTLDEESFSHGDYEARKLAQEFNEKQIRWLQQCPIILRVGQIAEMGEVVVVHAGLVPGVPLERQDPFQCMNMRSIDLETRLPSEVRHGTPWEKLWNHHQSSLPAVNRSTVLYGHDSKRGKNIMKYSKGLDSGCVNGGRLSALVIEAGKKDGKAKTTIVSVRCKRYR
ncbi:Metallo-dependent phosphatase [Lepidopterella palustris CBS 459.81]|uniref:Metallo-dependent phosphatase n=1 Tax=Lepidopterella palustris CBS 459.81 TaxID=1314670 RepID=A0A8E2EFR7_9PEZI|nr:Metallo-dependent phosphatase [Lepidopterella palustris CBS 459.81]